MITLSRSSLVVLVAAAGILAGCQTSEKITQRAELENPRQTRPIALITKDTAVYHLINYFLKDSSLWGAGSVEKDGIKGEFNGALPLSSIAYAQAYRTDFLRTLVAVGVAGLIGGTAASYLGGEGGASLGVSYSTGYTGYVPYGGGTGGSCPFIYSWNGSTYHLDGEAYAVAWGKTLETTTCSVLPSLCPDQGWVKIRLTNERPETHYYNAVSLKAVEVDAAADAVADANNVLWPIYRPLPPVRAVDGQGKEIAGLVSRPDGDIWESDLAGVSRMSSFQDVVDLTFSTPGSIESGTLVLHGINTGIFEVVLERIASLVGDQPLELVRALDEDQDLARIMRNWIDEASVKVSVWDGSKWSQAGVIRPEASVASFARCVRLNLSGFGKDSLRVRLSSLADVWKIDAVQLDVTPVVPLEPVEVPLVSASGPGKRDVAEIIRSSDQRYLSVLPSEKIELTYQALSARPGRKMVYALNVQGYLHEWVPSVVHTVSEAPLNCVAGENRIAFLKELLGLKELLLPPIYAEWKARKEAHLARNGK